MTICGGFQSMATRGFLIATIQNAGWVAADFTVGVVNCSAGVRAVVAQAASLPPQASQEITFALQARGWGALCGWVGGGGGSVRGRCRSLANEGGRGCVRKGTPPAPTPRHAVTPTPP